MRKLIVAEFITLDGVIQAPGDSKEDTDAGFAHGGKKLFPDGMRVNLKLIEATYLPTGVVYQRYEPVR